MEFRRVIRKQIHRDDDRVQLDADVNAVISVNVGGEGSAGASSHQRIVQRSGPGSRRRKDDGEEVTKHE